MTCFLTSSPTAMDGSGLIYDNDFIPLLRGALPSPCRALFVCSSPDDPERTDWFASSMLASLAEGGLCFGSSAVLDRRTQDKAADLIAAADFIILGGGHVPTQNRFFAEIGLKALLQGYDGVVMGISAGTMNSAETVYAVPEEEGEAIDPAFQRFLPGLGLTDCLLLPHYQMICHDVVDGLRLFEDIVHGDSFGRCFYAVPDGSFLYLKGETRQLRGECRRIRDGKMELIARVGDVLPVEALAEAKSIAED